MENVSFICADAGQAVMMLAERGERPDVLTVDPPRKGLDEMCIRDRYRADRPCMILKGDFYDRESF